jgi:hypothetical protein
VRVESAIIRLCPAQARVILAVVLNERERLPRGNRLAALEQSDRRHHRAKIAGLLIRNQTLKGLGGWTFACPYSKLGNAKQV